jgi:CHASE3 domain sensor protein
MTEAQTKQLIRQLKIMNTWIMIFGTAVLLCLVITGYMLWRVVTFTNKVESDVTQIRSTVTEQLDVRSRLCSSDNAVTGAVTDLTNICGDQP